MINQKLSSLSIFSCLNIQLEFFMSTDIPKKENSQNDIPKKEYFTPTLVSEEVFTVVHAAEQCTASTCGTVYTRGC